jgi:hypothetical protein
VTPDATSQHIKPALDVWSGYDAWCVGYVGGFTREIIAEFKTLDEAEIAYRAARNALVQIKEAIS